MQTELQNFLNQLTEAQIQMLAVLHKQQAILVRPDKDSIALVAAEEKKALETMQEILKRREELLTTARLQNIQGDSIEQLCEHFFPHNIEIHKLLAETSHRTHQIRLLAYTNWTMSRQSLIHVSQILELLDTCGQGKTTYQPHTNSSRSRLVDRVA